MPSFFVLIKLGFPSAQFYLVFSIPVIPHFDGCTIAGKTRWLNLAQSQQSQVRQAKKSATKIFVIEICVFRSKVGILSLFRGAGCARCPEQVNLFPKNCTMSNWGIVGCRQNIDICHTDNQIWTVSLQSMERKKPFQRVIPPKSLRQS